MNLHTVCSSSVIDDGQSKKIKYKFVTGETSEVEVTEELATFLAECDREDANNDRKERYHCLSMNAAEYEGLDYSDGTTPEVMLLRLIEHDLNPVRLQEAFSTLTEVQKRRLLMLVSKMTYEEIAKAEGVYIRAIAQSIDASRKKIKKFFRKHI